MRAAATRVLDRKARGDRLDGVPATVQRVHDYGLDEKEDVVLGGVVGTDHGALGGVERALDAQGDIGDDGRVDDELPIAEQLDENGLPEFEAGFAEREHRGEPEPRQQVGRLQPPEIGREARRDQGGRIVFPRPISGG